MTKIGVQGVHALHYNECHSHVKLAPRYAQSRQEMASHEPGIGGTCGLEMEAIGVQRNAIKK